LEVRVEHEIGRGTTRAPGGRHVVYLACTTVTATALRGPCTDELVEVRWLDWDQV